MKTILSFENVSLMKENKQLLSDINWTINSKENWALLGLNGAGKTTLLKMIHGDVWPSTGKLEVLGGLFGHTNIPDLKKKIGWVSAALQDWLRPGDLVEEIVLSGKFASIGLYESYSDQDLEMAKRQIRKLGAGQLIGKSYRMLSQGERQLVLIARALMAKPALLILDEPCNGLDLFAREKLLTKISEIAQAADSPSLLLVSHYTEELLPCFDHVLLLRKGSVYARGRQQDLLTKKVLTDFYESPIEIATGPNKRISVYPSSQL